MREKEVKPRGPGRPFVSPYISLCADCQVCTCRWAYGEAVPGWRAEPLEEEAERCAVCGAAWPEYQVQEPGRGVIGCESCLVIRKGGAIQ